MVSNNGNNAGQSRPSTTFSPPVSPGIFLNWQKHQLIIIGICVMLIMLPFVGGSKISVRNICLGFVIAFTAVTKNRRSMWQLLGIRLGYAARAATGQTRWTQSPASVNSEVAYIDLPGATGKRLKPYAIVNTAFDGACFLWDVQRREATAVLRLMGTGFKWQDDSEKNERTDAWSNFMKQVAEMPDVVRVVTQARTVPMPTVSTRKNDGSWADRQLQHVEDNRMPQHSGHDLILSVTINPHHKSVRKEVFKHGGGMKGISQVLSKRLETLVRMAAKAGADPKNVVWLSAGQIRGLMKTMADNSAFTCLDENGVLPDDIPVSTSYREFSDCIQAGNVCARTFWIDKWPDRPVQGGFLQTFIEQHSDSLIFTQVWKGLPADKAAKALNNRKNELERLNSLNARLGRNADKNAVYQQMEADARLDELVHAGADVAFQGFITVIADNKTVLDKRCANLKTNNASIIHLDPMRGQQWSGWVYAQPLGQAGRAD